MRPLLLSVLLVTAAAAAEPLTLKLWPQGAPEPAGFQPKPETEENRNDGVRRLAHVSDPTITVYRPAKPNGTAVLVCPGGGYSILAIEHEGTQVCEWLNSLGVTGVLLKYRVPKRSDPDPGREPLQDAQRALGLIRRHAGEWGLRSDRIGILGFSAGGHLCLMAALHPNERTYPVDATLDVEDVTPNFAIPIYPAYLVAPQNLFQLKPEFSVTDRSPPVCLVHAHDDKGVTSPAASALLYLEYKKRERPAELHIYTRGGHGFGMKRNGVPANEWPARVADWMRTTGLIDPAAQP